MNPIDFVILAVIAVIGVAAGRYVYKSKKSGKKCIGCPGGCSCPSGNGGCCCASREK